MLESHILVLSKVGRFESEQELLYPRIQSRHRITLLEAARPAAFPPVFLDKIWVRAQTPQCSTS